MTGVDAELLRRARAAGGAIVGFSIYTLEQGMGVVRAAEELGAPVLLQAGSSAFRYAGRRPLAQLALALAEDAAVPVGVHLDHATGLDEIRACLDAGYGSVMYDGSARPYEENVAITRRVAELAHRRGAWVEAELAGIAGDEDASVASAAGALTDPALAADFVGRTGVDALAVAIGNVHGMAAEPQALDLERLRSIAEAVEVPLVLHGASGLPEAEVAAAVALGVAKLNVNTELRHALVGAIVELAAQPPASDAVAAWMGPIVQATRRAAREKIEAFTAPAMTSQEERAG